MAFANLFKTLSPAEGHHAIPCQSTQPHKNGVQEVCATQRPTPCGQQTGQKKKKKRQHLNQAVAAKTHGPPRFYDYDKPVGVPFNHRGKGQFHHRGAFSQKNNHHNNWQENANSQSYRGGFPRGRQFHQGDRRGWFPRGRGHSQTHQNKRGSAVRHMTQEFKDQNALQVDGQLLCKHFLMGRCTKGAECQLVHAITKNDLIKDVCKFYIQGSCSKGESCAYMHSSFPCKYFHQWGKCAKEGECRFSHEPLTELTKQLLDQAIQREKDLSETARNKERESLAPPAAADQGGAAGGACDPKQDILLHPIRPQFYNSSCPEEPAAELEELIGVEPDRGPDRSGSASPSCGPPNSKAVPYSVEAVLAPGISKPFPSLFGSNGDSASSSSPPRSFAPLSVPAHRVEAPYSVEAVLRSVKSVGSSNLTPAREPPPSANPPWTYYGSDLSKEFPKASRFSGPFRGKDSRLEHNTGEAIDAEARPNGNQDVPSSNQGHKQAKRCLPVNKCVPPYYQSSTEGIGVVINSNSSTDVRVPPVQPETRPAEETRKAFHSLFANPLNQNVFNPPRLTPLPAAAPSTPRHSAPSNPRHSAPSPTRATPSTNRKEKTASADANAGHSTHVPARPLALKPEHGPSAAFKVAKPAVPSGSKSRSTESPGPSPQAKTACRASAPAHCDRSVLGRSKPVKRPYHSSMASSGTDTDEDLPPLQIAMDPMVGSSDSPEPSDGEPPVKASGGVLRGLFATPIHQTTAIAPPPSTPGHRGPWEPCPAGGSGAHHTRTPGAAGSPASRPGPKHPKEKEQESRTTGPPPPPAHSVRKNLHMPEISSEKAPSHAATNTSNSVLKSLFLNLRPYNQEEQRVTHSKSGDKDEINHRAISKEPQTTGEEEEEEEEEEKEEEEEEEEEEEKEEEEEEARRKAMRSTEMLGGVEPAGCHVHPDHQGSGEPPSQPPAPAHHRSLEKNPHSRSPRPSAVRPAGRLDPVQLLSHGAEQPPIGSNGPLTRPQSRPPLTSMKGLLSSLFKTLDPAASPFGN